MTQSWLAGVALSGTSVAIVYAEMMLHGLNGTDFGKILLGACFVTDFAIVLALGLLFTQFTVKTAMFAVVTLASCVILPWLTPRLFNRYGERPSELETKFLLVCLLALGALATWADSEAVLPAYLIGIPKTFTQAGTTQSGPSRWRLRGSSPRTRCASRSVVATTATKRLMDRSYNVSHCTISRLHA